MDRLKIFIATPDKNSLKQIKNIILKNGYKIIAEAEDGPSALRFAHTLDFDLAIIDFNLPAINGIEVSRVIQENKNAPVILIISARNKNIIEKARDLWIYSFLMKPITENNLMAAVDSTMMGFEKERKLQKELTKLQNTIETRKIVEKAKGLLMQSFDLSEQEAFRKIQKQSMERGKSMKKIAEAIILLYEN